MLPFPPGARNEKAPARFLSGRTSAMFKACVKGGRVVNAFFCFLATLYADARDGPDVTTERTSQRIRPTIGFQWMAERISIAFEIGWKQLDGDAPWGSLQLDKAVICGRRSNRPAMRPAMRAVSGLSAQKAVVGVCSAKTQICRWERTVAALPCAFSTAPHQSRFAQLRNFP